MNTSSQQQTTQIGTMTLSAKMLLVLLIIAGVYFFHSFLVPILAALVIGFASWPLYRRIRSGIGGSDTLASTISILLVMTFLVVPISLAALYAFHEALVWVEWIMATNKNGASTPAWITALPLIGGWLDEKWTEIFGQPGSLSILLELVNAAEFGSIYRTVMSAGGSVVHLTLNLVFMLITLFFVYRDGEKIAAQVNLIGEKILPNRWASFSNIVPATINSTVTGMTLIAVGEGIVLGIAYWIADVPSPAALGLLTGVMAFIPGGAPLSFTLVSVYLVARGTWVSGLLLFLWGSIELFIVDKTLRPRLVGGPIRLPFLPTFFGLIGGVKTMGFLGLFIGPVLMALLVGAWREWVSETRKRGV